MSDQMEGFVAVLLVFLVWGIYLFVDYHIDFAVVT